MPTQAQAVPTWKQHGAKSERRRSEDGPKIGMESKVQNCRSARTYGKTYVFCHSQGRRAEEKMVPRWGRMGAQLGPNRGQHEASVQPSGPKMRARRSQDQPKMGQDGGKMRPSRSGNEATLEPRWRQVGAQMWVGGGLLSASWRLLGASLRHSGGHLGSGSSMQGGAHEQQHGTKSGPLQGLLGRTGEHLEPAAIICEPALGSLGAIMVGLGALLGHPRRAPTSLTGPPRRPQSGKQTKWNIPYICRYKNNYYKL